MANDPTTWFEKDLDDFLKELHCDDAEVIDQNKIEEDEERLRQIIVNVNARQWTNICKIMDDF